ELGPDQVKWLLGRTARAVAGDGTGAGYPQVGAAVGYAGAVERANRGLAPSLHLQRAAAARGAAAPAEDGRGAGGRGGGGRGGVALGRGRFRRERLGHPRLGRERLGRRGGAGGARGLISTGAPASRPRSRRAGRSSTTRPSRSAARRTPRGRAAARPTSGPAR